MPGEVCFPDYKKWVIYWTSFTRNNCTSFNQWDNNVIQSLLRLNRKRILSSIWPKGWFWMYVLPVTYQSSYSQNHMVTLPIKTQENPLLRNALLLFLLNAHHFLHFAWLKASSLQQRKDEWRGYGELVLRQKKKRVLSLSISLQSPHLLPTTPLTKGFTLATDLNA